MDFSGVLSALTSANGVVGFLVLIAPGFVAIRTMEMRISGERRKAGDAIIDIVLFSLVTDLLWSLVLNALGVRPLTEWPLWAQALGLFALVFVTPVALALLYLNVRERMSGPGGAIGLYPKPWDKAFGRYFNEAVQIVMTTADGRRVGGRWQAPCYASGYPSPEQIFISDVFAVDQITGELIAKIPHHRGILIDKSSIDFVEFFDYNRPFVPPKAAIASPPNTSPP